MGISLLLCEGIYLKFKWFLCSQWLSGETEVHLFRPTVHANSESEEPFQSIIWRKFHHHSSHCTTTKLLGGVNAAAMATRRLFLLYIISCLTNFLSIILTMSASWVVSELQLRCFQPVDFMFRVCHALILVSVFQYTQVHMKVQKRCHANIDIREHLMYLNLKVKLELWLQPSSPLVLRLVLR
jgi:hypothetical protein